MWLLLALLLQGHTGTAAPVIAAGLIGALVLAFVAGKPTPRAALTSGLAAMTLAAFSYVPGGLLLASGMISDMASADADHESLTATVLVPVFGGMMASVLGIVIALAGAILAGLLAMATTAARRD